MYISYIDTTRGGPRGGNERECLDSFGDSPDSFPDSYDPWDDDGPMLVSDLPYLGSMGVPI